MSQTHEQPKSTGSNVSAGLLPSIAKLARHSVNESNSGKPLGYLQSAQFSGQVAGPLLGAQIGAHVGLREVFFVTSGLLLAGAVNQWGRTRIITEDAAHIGRP